MHFFNSFGWFQEDFQTNKSNKLNQKNKIIKNSITIPRKKNRKKSRKKVNFHKNRHIYIQNLVFSLKIGTVRYQPLSVNPIWVPHPLSFMSSLHLGPSPRLYLFMKCMNSREQPVRVAWSYKGIICMYYVILCNKISWLLNR